MSQRAKAREAARIEAENERLRQLREPQYAHFVETLPALPGETRLTLDHWDDDHVGHLTHFDASHPWQMCSCGEIGGMPAYVPPDEPPPPCEICKARKIGEFAERPRT